MCPLSHTGSWVGSVGLLRGPSRTVWPLTDSRFSILHSNFEGYLKWRREKLTVLSLIFAIFQASAGCAGHAICLEPWWRFPSCWWLSAWYRLESWNMAGENRLKMARRSRTTLTNGMADKWSPCAARRNDVVAWRLIATMAQIRSRLL